MSLMVIRLSTQNTVGEIQGEKSQHLLNNEIPEKTHQRF